MIIAVACAMIGFGTIGRFDFNLLVQKLENKEISEGAPIAEFLDPSLGKPVCSITREADGVRYNFMMYEHRGRVLTAYFKDESLYACCYMVGVEESLEKWFFCDHEKLRSHIEISIKKAR